MTFQSQPDFGAIYAGSQQQGAGAPPPADMAKELAAIGITSLEGLTPDQLQAVGVRLSKYRAEQAAGSVQAAMQTEADFAAMNGDVKLDADGNPVAPEPGEAQSSMDPAKWVAYLQRLGPQGYGGDPADYANALYDAHSKVAMAAPAEGEKPKVEAKPITPGEGPKGRDESGAVTDQTMADLNGYIANLQAVKDPTAKQQSTLAKYVMRKGTYDGQNAQTANRVRDEKAANVSINPNAAADAEAAKAAKVTAPGVVTPIKNYGAEVGKLDSYISNLSAIKAPTAAQKTQLATYQARKVEYAGR